MGHHHLPLRRVAVEVLTVDVAERSQREEELIAVLGGWLEIKPAGAQSGAAPVAGDQPVEARGQQESAVMVGVIAQEPISLWRLGRDGSQRRVRIDHSNGSVEAVVRDAA